MLNPHPLSLGTTLASFQHLKSRPILPLGVCNQEYSLHNGHIPRNLDWVSPDAKVSRGVEDSINAYRYVRSRIIEVPGCVAVPRRKSRHDFYTSHNSPRRDWTQITIIFCRQLAADGPMGVSMADPWLYGGQRRR